MYLLLVFSLISPENSNMEYILASDYDRVTGLYCSSISEIDDVTIYLKE